MEMKQNQMGKPNGHDKPKGPCKNGMNCTKNGCHFLHVPGGGDWMKKIFCRNREGCESNKSGRCGFNHDPAMRLT